jgi:DNA-binding beta-propeller fold protein YncE
MHRRLIAVFLFLGCLILLDAGCTRHLNRTSARKQVITYPSPPDTARIQFLTTFSNSEITGNRQSGFSRFLFGNTPVKQIKKPYGIAVHDGKIYICDTGLGLLEVIDLKKNTFTYFNPQGKGKLKFPINCFVDDDGKIYVADGSRLQVIVYDAQENYLGAFGESDKFKPTDVFVSGDRIFVSNIKNNKILVYNKDTRKLLYSFPDIEQGQPGFLYSPANLYVTRDKIYVSDIGDFKVKIYTREGNYISSVGSNGSEPGQFVRPKGIAVDTGGNLYVVDASFENTQIFNKEGHVLLFFGGPYKGPGDMWLPAKITLDYNNMKFFQKYLDPEYKLNYLIFVTNQYGPDKINVYGSISAKK